MMAEQRNTQEWKPVPLGPLIYPPDTAMISEHYPPISRSVRIKSGVGNPINTFLSISYAQAGSCFKNTGNSA